MDLNAIAEYLPLFGEAALLTVKLGVLGIIFSDRKSTRLNSSHIL